MARRGRRSAASTPTPGRASVVGSRALQAALPRLSAMSHAAHVDDALAFVRHPEFVASAVARRRPRFLPAKPQFVPSRSRRSVWSALSMVSPKRVLFCLRRKIRKEVMFAIGRSGRNGGRVYRRRQESSYAC